MPLNKVDSRALTQSHLVDPYGAARQPQPDQTAGAKELGNHAPPPPSTDPRLNPVSEMVRATTAMEIVDLMAKRAQITPAQLAYPAWAAALTKADQIMQARLTEITS